MDTTPKISCGVNTNKFNLHSSSIFFTKTLHLKNNKRERSRCHVTISDGLSELQFFNTSKNLLKILLSWYILTTLVKGNKKYATSSSSTSSLEIFVKIFILLLLSWKAMSAVTPTTEDLNQSFLLSIRCWNIKIYLDKFKITQNSV